jgi:penicillin-insensitive murein endopeptidase
MFRKMHHPQQAARRDAPAKAAMLAPASLLRATILTRNLPTLLIALTAALLTGHSAFADPVRIVGGPSVGCIAGAVELPPQGPGYQTIHVAISHFWGAPSTVAGIEQLGRKAQEAGLGNILVEELGRQYGGPMVGGHASHQTGVDADVALDTNHRRALSPNERETIELTSVVRADRRGVRPDRWNDDVVKLLALATQLPQIDRILVNPAIKRQLCDTVAGDRSWLRFIRPWYGHAAHMHVHFRCPPGQASCVDLPPPPPGDSCDATLQWWFDQLDAPPAKPGPPKPPTPLPVECKAIMAGR